MTAFRVLSRRVEENQYIVHFSLRGDNALWLNLEALFFSEGIDSIEIGGDLESVLSSTPTGMELRRNPSLFKIRALKHIFSSMIEEWFSAIMSGMRDADLIVLSFGSLLAGLSCLEKFPYVRAVGIYTFPILRTAEYSPAGIGGESEGLFGWINLMKWKMFEYASFSIHIEKINQLRGGIDLPPIKWDYGQLIQSILHKPLKTATIYSKYLLPIPSDWRENDLMVGPILDEDHSHFVPSAAMLEYLDKWKNEKIVYVGMGSMMSAILEAHEQIHFLKNIQAAMDNNNCIAIISLVGVHQMHTDHLSNTDRVFYLMDSIPHNWLFTNVSAAIHHGGAGTTHASIRYGLPTLILTFTADQPFNADRVFINKLGPKHLPVRQTNVKNLTKAINDLINENYHMYTMNAKKMGESMKNEDGLGHCVRLIEEELIVEGDTVA